MSEIKCGCVARCSRGMLGLVTSDTKVLTRYGDQAWTGVQLDPDKAGKEWCSRNPTFVANSVAELEQPWIVISERQPADGDTVFATDEYSVAELRYFSGFGFECVGGDEPPFAVTRWMPRPLPPRQN